jgi:hypothetical protein
MLTWNNQNKHMEEKINVKMLQLTIENKEMKQKLVDFLELTKGMHGVKEK